MFWRTRTQDEPSTEDPEPRCSFCKRSQDDVRKLIAGPNVFICDDCVQVCVDIVADDNLGPGIAEQLVRATTPQWSSAISCTLCRMPVVLEEVVQVDGRAFLCPQCVSAIRSALAEAEAESGLPDAKQG